MELLELLDFGKERGMRADVSPAHDEGGARGGGLDPLDWFGAAPAAGGGLGANAFNLGKQKPEGENFGEYAYLNQNKSGWGLDYGAGFRIGGSNWGFDMLSFNGSTGLMQDEKGTRFGTKFNGGFGKLELNKDGQVQPDVGIGTASGEGSIGTNGASFGGQANVAEGNVTATKLPFGTTVRAGASSGEGLGLRLHWSDDDHNGKREYGIGGDLGPASWDFKTEAHPLNWLFGK